MTNTASQYVVRTAENTISYLSPQIARIYNLNNVNTVTVIATAWTADGHFTSGFFSMDLIRPLDVDVSANVLSTSSDPSHANPGSFADYYQLKSSGLVACIVVSTNGTCGYLYDVNLVNTASDCDNTGTGSEGFYATLTAEQPYYFEVSPTPLSNQLGLYYLITKALSSDFFPSLVSSPWADGRTYEGAIAGQPGGFVLDPVAQATTICTNISQVGSNSVTNVTSYVMFADYYKVTGGGTTTFSTTFTPPSGYNPPCGSVGVVTVFDSGLTNVPSVLNNPNQFFLLLGDIYYVEVASFESTTPTDLRSIDYRISIDNGTMIPTTNPFP